jgi:hypothetical protein
LEEQRSVSGKTGWTTEINAGNTISTRAIAPVVITAGREMSGKSAKAMTGHVVKVAISKLHRMEIQNVRRNRVTGIETWGIQRGFAEDSPLEFTSPMDSGIQKECKFVPALMPVAITSRGI